MQQLGSDFVQKRMDEQGRSFLQRRLALMGKVGFYFAAPFVVISNIANHLDAGMAWVQIVHLRSNVFHVLLVLLFLGCWLACRTARYSYVTLRILDTGLTWGACLACALAAWDPHHPGNLRYRMLLEITSVLMCRAAIVPSSARLTLAAGALAVPAAAHAAYVFQRAVQAAGAARSEYVVPLASAPVGFALAESALYSLLSVAVATIASDIIYGLRRQVREARKLGPYTLKQRLGEGGMGVVYLATHALLRRPTAVKLLPPEKSGERSVERFEREVQLTSQLTHPNTVSIYDYGRTSDGVFYYAMEYLDGLNLDELVRCDGAQQPARVVHILRQVCAALAEAHQLGLVHRDIKPANIILGQRWGAWDVVKVVDFGLVRELRHASGAEHNVIVGTPSYLPPEAIRSGSQLEPRSDLYGVGAVGYFLLTGCELFEARTLVEMLNHQLNTAPTPPSERVGQPIPAELERLVMSCLDKDVSQRPASAAELGRMLEQCAGAWSEAEACRWWAGRPVAAGRAVAATRTLDGEDLS